MKSSLQKARFCGIASFSTVRDKKLVLTDSPFFMKLHFYAKRKRASKKRRSHKCYKNSWLLYRLQWATSTNTILESPFRACSRTAWTSIWNVP